MEVVRGNLGSRIWLFHEIRRNACIGKAGIQVHGRHAHVDQSADHHIRHQSAVASYE